MAKMVFSRNDILALAKRMERRSWSPLMNDMPETQRDLRACSTLLCWFLAQGMPVTIVELPNGDNDNGIE
jgi:hypothetical protein